MKLIAQMTVEELAAFVCQTLEDAGITVTLTGGSCVTIWSHSKYVSHDLDFIEESLIPRRKVQLALDSIGFKPDGRHFVHPDSKFLVEFPNGPLMVGNERVEKTSKRITRVGSLRLLTPTDCVKDRLCAYFYWNDRQAFEQAILVARAQRIDLKNVRAWAHAEGQDAKIDLFLMELKKQKR